MAVARGALGFRASGGIFIVFGAGGTGALLAPAGEGRGVDVVVGRGPAADVVVLVLPAASTSAAKAATASAEIVVVVFKGRGVVVVVVSGSSSSLAGAWASVVGVFVRATAAVATSVFVLFVFLVLVVVIPAATKPFAAAPAAAPSAAGSSSSASASASSSSSAADPSSCHLPQQGPDSPRVAVASATGRFFPVLASRRQPGPRPQRAVLVRGLRVGDQGGAGRGEAGADRGRGEAVVVVGVKAAGSRQGRHRRRCPLHRQPPGSELRDPLVGAELRSAVEGPCGVVASVVGVVAAEGRVAAVAVEVRPRPGASLLVERLLLLHLHLHLLLLLVVVSLLLRLLLLLLVVELVVDARLLLRRGRERHQRDAKWPAARLAARAARAPEEGRRGAALGRGCGEGGAVRGC